MPTAVALVIYIAILASGLAFRRGRPEWWARRVARSYRDPRFGRAMSSLPVITPFGAILFLPLLVPIWALMTRHLPDWPHWERSLGAWGFASYGAFAMGTSLLVAVRRPAWLVPRWLREDEMRNQWTPPSVGFTDRVLVVVGVAFLVGGVAFISAAIAGASGTPGL